MSTETEAKLALPDPAALAARLAALGAPRVARFREDNRFFDRPGDPLRVAGSVLRLRTETPWGDAGPAGPTGGPPRHVLCFKGPRDAATAALGVKQREEVEAVVADADDAAALLVALGYARRFRFQKLRERHRLGPCVVEIDRVPGLGPHLEVEGPDADAVEDTLRRLGLAKAPREPRGYLTLLLEEGRASNPPDAAEGPEFLFR